MSLEALAAVMYADTDHDCFRVLVHLADAADENHVTVPNLDRLAVMANMSAIELADVLARLVAGSVIEPANDHPLDMLDGTEGFRILVKRIRTTCVVILRRSDRQPLDYASADRPLDDRIGRPGDVQRIAIRENGEIRDPDAASGARWLDPRPAIQPDQADAALPGDLS